VVSAPLCPGRGWACPPGTTSAPSCPRRPRATIARARWRGRNQAAAVTSEDLDLVAIGQEPGEIGRNLQARALVDPRRHLCVGPIGAAVAVLVERQVDVVHGDHDVYVAGLLRHVQTPERVVGGTEGPPPGLISFMVDR